MLAAGIDADGGIVLLAWAIVESENRESWEYFFRLLLSSMPLETAPWTFISDRDKGGEAASDALGNFAEKIVCCKHLEQNFVSKFKSGLKSLFWSAAKARSVFAFEAVMRQLKDTNEKAEAYLRDIDPQLWTISHGKARRFGHLTSNIAESCNNLLLTHREMPVVQMLNEIWHLVMHTRATRRTEAEKSQADGQLFTRVAMYEIQESKRWANSNYVSQKT